MFKRAKVVMLPTNEKAELIRTTDSNNLYHKDNQNLINSYIGKTSNSEWINLYIIEPTTNASYSKGDWFLCIYEDNSISSPIQITGFFKTWLVSGNIEYERHRCRKIITTTDESLTMKQGTLEYPLGEFNLPKPSNSFISKYTEEYNKCNQIIDIFVEYNQESDFSYHFKEQLKINSKDNTITIKKIKDTYTKKEVEETIQSYLAYLLEEIAIESHIPKTTFDKVTEKFINSKL